MEATKHCVYNKATERFLSVGTTVTNTTAEPLEFLEAPANADTMSAEWGIWLRPFNTIPNDRIQFPIDVVYLNEDRRVVKGFELTPNDTWPQVEDHIVSALILPYHSVDSSRTYPGDQFIICEAQELVRQLARVPDVKDAESRANCREGGLDASCLGPEATAKAEKNTEPGVTGKRDSLRGSRKLEIVRSAAPGEPAPSQIGRGSLRSDAMPQTADPGSKKNPQTNLEPDEIESVVSQVLQWSRTGGVRASADANGLDITALPLGSGAASGFLGDIDISSRDLKFTEDRQSALRNVNEIEDLEAPRQNDRENDAYRSPDFETVISEVMQWAEETGRPVGRAQEQIRLAPSSGKARAAVPGVATQASSRRPGSGANAGKVKPNGHSIKSRVGRWADELTAPLAKTSGTALRGDQRPEVPDLSKGERISSMQAVLHKFKENGKVLFTAEGIHTLKTRFVHWLDEGSVNAKREGPVDRRRSNRHALPDLIAYYWTGGTPQAHRVGDISSTGFYLLTNERWVPETVIRMTLQRTLGDGANSEDAISVLSKVVRWGEDGVGHEFILLDSVDMRSGRLTSGKERVQQALQQYL